MMRYFLILIAMASTVLAGNSTTHVWIPEFPAMGRTDIGAYTTNLVQCTSWVPTIGITNATAMVWFTTAGSGGTKCSLAIFDDNGGSSGGSKLMDSGLVACDVSAAPRVATGLSPQTFAAGHKYNVCTCASTGTLNYLTASNSADLGSGLSQAVTPGQLRTAANACTAGAMPASTGTMSNAAVNAIIALLATNTP